VCVCVQLTKKIENKNLFSIFFCVLNDFVYQIAHNFEKFAIKVAKRTVFNNIIISLIVKVTITLVTITTDILLINIF